MTNIYDNRSVVGQYLRGKNVYGAGGTAPNPSGKNQHSRLKRAAKLKRLRKLKGHKI